MEQQSVQIPARCMKCGRFFRSGIAATNAYGVTLKDNLSGPCPFCGSMGRILDGTFNFVNGTIELISGPATTINDLRDLRQIIRQARAERWSGQKLEAEIATQVPRLKSLALWLGQNQQWIAVWLSVLLALLNYLDNTTETASPDQTFNQVRIDHDIRIDIDQLISIAGDPRTDIDSQSLDGEEPVSPPHD